MTRLLRFWPLFLVFVVWGTFFMLRGSAPQNPAVSDEPARLEFYKVPQHAALNETAREPLIQKEAPAPETDIQEDVPVEVVR